MQRRDICARLRFSPGVKVRTTARRTDGSPSFVYVQFLLTQVIYRWLRGNHEHLPVRRKEFRRWDYAYRYFILVVSRTSAAAIVSLIAVRAVS